MKNMGLTVKGLKSCCDGIYCGKFTFKWGYNRDLANNIEQHPTWYDIWVSPNLGGTGPEILTSSAEKRRPYHLTLFSNESKWHHPKIQQLLTSNPIQLLPLVPTGSNRFLVPRFRYVTPIGCNQIHYPSLGFGDKKWLLISSVFLEGGVASIRNT